mmetsp:Transcript_85671/g.135277  ORF Transcript_85671/g.135277 Transcript_85671/m.135277 type:complete len:304 (-) Transcript_85671:79-990(-)|eukprot:CAMPEP_0169081516 /NCGR_PEP_ID=MMETSP1015-20121227/11053_1 /TAXON_ID=342587 /ORGANISM="Karlodinium micrum, Strain CCMP2283" /LENGTH=303 /DNA_ID=CAMNT_0009141311 /DNA_START=93 /DNA_END=1004 /DNA_ORIENTATION=+
MATQPPPSSPPPPANGQTAQAPPASEVGTDLRKEILARIGDQVNTLLMQAKKDSESKVKFELKALNDVMRQMEERLDAITGQLDEMEETPKQAVEPATVAQALAKLEQQWGKELGKLKQELHQTIFAHNHNADLMKHQKDALDQIRQEIDSQKASPGNERIKMAKDKLAKADAMLKNQQKQRKLEPLFRRLTTLESKLMAWRWPMGMMGQMGPMGGMPPMGMPPMPGAQPPGLNMAAAARIPNWGGKPGGPKAGVSQANPPRSAVETPAAVEGPAPGLEKDDADDGDVDDEDGPIEDEAEADA